MINGHNYAYFNDAIGNATRTLVTRQRSAANAIELHSLRSRTIHNVCEYSAILMADTILADNRVPKIEISPAHIYLYKYKKYTIMEFFFYTNRFFN